MKTTNTTVSKITSTKKRGRPVGSKKAKVNDTSFWDKQWQEFEIPDAEATVNQIKTYDRFTWGEEPINYWKYACIAILLGIVTAMIFSTPTIIRLFDACVQ